MELTRWLIEELERRGWTQRELARRADTTSTTVSDVINGKRRPTWEFCEKIAQALGEPPTRLFRLAGLLTTPALDDATAQQILDTLRDMTHEERSDVLEYAKMRYRRGREK